VLELPQKADDADALEHWTREVRKFKEHLEHRFRTRVTDEKLRDAIQLMNRERGLRRQLADLMTTDNPRLSGRQLLELKSIISGIEADLQQYEAAICLYGDNARTAPLSHPMGEGGRRPGENSPKRSRIEPLNLVGTRCCASGRAAARPYQVHGEALHHPSDPMGYDFGTVSETFPIPTGMADGSRRSKRSGDLRGREERATHPKGVPDHRRASSYGTPPGCGMFYDALTGSRIPPWRDSTSGYPLPPLRGEATETDRLGPVS